MTEQGGRRGTCIGDLLPHQNSAGLHFDYADAGEIDIAFRALQVRLY